MMLLQLMLMLMLMLLKLLLLLRMMMMLLMMMLQMILETLMMMHYPMVQLRSARRRRAARQRCCRRRHRRRWRRWRRFVAGLVLVRSHVAGQMVALAEALVAHRTLELLLALAPIRVAGEFALVMRPHVVHQIAGHAKADVAFGAHVLRRQRE